MISRWGAGRAAWAQANLAMKPVARSKNRRGRMPHDTGDNAGGKDRRHHQLRSGERDPHQKLSLVLVAFDGAGRRRVEQEMLRPPTRVSDLRRKMENNQVDV